MAPLVTIGTGGSAAALVTAEEAVGTVGVLKILCAESIPSYCLGAGSDLLVADDGYRGVVIRLGEGLGGISGLEDADGPGSDFLVEAGGAVSIAEMAALAAEAGLTGLEFACGIPGSVGGGVATNAGAYGKAFSDVLAEVQVASAEGVSWVPTGELEWEYRHCRLPAGTVVTAVRFHLERDERETILERHRSTLEMRRSVQPQGVKTFGSTFKNPSGGAAGRLLDAAGLKGERRGGAEVSKVHANFVVNLGDASTADVLDLMDHMRHMVHETSGVLLEPEVRLLGADFPWRSSADEAHWLSSADG